MANLGTQSKPGKYIVRSSDPHQLSLSMAVNQAAGRVVRHRHDYGAILFVDPRYGSKDRMHELSGWIVKRLYSSNMNQAMPWQAINERMEHFFAARNVTAAMPVLAPPSVAPAPRPPASAGSERPRSAVRKPDAAPVAMPVVTTTTATDDQSSWAADLDCSTPTHQPNEPKILTKENLAQQKEMRRSEKAAEALKEIVVEPKKRGVRVTDFFNANSQAHLMSHSESASAKLAERVQSKLNVRRVRAALNTESRFGMKGGGLLTPVMMTDSVDGDANTPTPHINSSGTTIKKEPAWLRPVRTLHRPSPPPSPSAENKSAPMSETIFEESICEICCVECSNRTDCCDKLLCQKCFRKSSLCPYCRRNKGQFSLV